MNRDEQLKFCKVCKNRKMDMNKGIICSLTNEVATFENTCDTYDIDQEAVDKQKTLEQKEELQTPPPKEILNTLSPEILDRLRFSQDYLYAILGGLAAALLSATLWATITVATEYQIGYMAIGVGLIVGFSVRYFGAGIDAPFGFIGAFMAIIGCLLGNIFTQIWFFADYQNMSFFNAFKLVNGSALIDIVTDTFNPMDILFYGIALYEGYKFSFRSVTSEEIHLMNESHVYDPIPSNQKLRMPIVIIIFIGLSVLLFTVRSGSNGIQQFFYDDGTLMSEGELVDGTVNGSWKYFDTNGVLYLEGSYNNGIEDGLWKWYNFKKEVIKTGNYDKGNPIGIWVNYDDIGNTLDSGNYVNGRMMGIWTYKYPSGQISAVGEMYLDYPHGEWNYYNEIGQKVSVFTFDKGILSGKAKTYYGNGQLAQELEYFDNDNLRIITAQSPDSKIIVESGNGNFQSFHQNGNIKETGIVKNGKRIGEWISYYDNSNLMSKGTYDTTGIFVINQFNNDFGEVLVKEGNGKMSLVQQDGTFEEGQIINGYKSGSWSVYNSSGKEILSEMNYNNGQLVGIIKQYFSGGGTLQYEGFYEKGKLSGISNWYFENGEIQTTVTFINGKKEGSQTFFNDVGIQIREEKYSNGELKL